MHAAEYAIRWELIYGTRLVPCFAERPGSVDVLFRQAVARARHEPALSDADRRLTYAELDAEVDRLAAGLLGIGLTAGDRVALLLGNRIEAVSLLLACARSGLVAVPVGIRLSRAEVLYICADSGAGAIVFESVFAQAVPERELLPHLGARFVVGDPVQGARPYAELMAAAGAAPSSPKAEDPLLICYTSGTTGKPKGAVVTHLALVHGAMHLCLGMNLPDRSVTVLALPVAHIGGIGNCVMILHAAGRIAMLREFKARKLLELAERERMTYFAGVPTMYSLLLLEPELRRFDLSAWHLALISGAPTSPAIERDLAATWPHLTLCPVYGATETATAITIMPCADRRADAKGVGLCVPCGDIRVVDDNGIEVPRGEPGELWISGPMVTPGYWNDPVSTEKAIVGGYWKSGDIGRVDENGYVEVLDRKKDMIARGGFKVFAAEVEHVLCDFPGILEAAVVGRADPVLGERSIAFVTSTDRLDQAALRDYCATRLSDYKVPDRFVIASDALPRNANGKIDKPRLRQFATRE